MTMPRKWVIIIPVVIGIAAFAFLKKNKMEPLQEPLQEKAKLVRVITPPTLAVIPKAKGHGTVQPSRNWQAVAQVKGKIIEKHPRLQKGSILEADTLILRIDPTDYELAVAQAEADIQATRAQLSEQDARAANSRASLKIEEAALALNNKELQRKRQLVGKGSVSHSDLESQERSLLGQQQVVQAQKNTLNLIPSQKALLQAQLARHQATLAAARRNLANTKIRLPFTGRIAEVNVEQERYIREGEVLARVDGMARAEIETQIPIEQMSHLVPHGTTVNILNRGEMPTRERMGISARVQLQEGALSADWDARFARFSNTLDPKTRTIGVIVEVDEPYSQVLPGSRPPLIKGLFVEVTLTGKPRPGSPVVPRSALHDGHILIADGENRLRKKAVQITLLQPEYAVISAPLAEGEQLVISDLTPAIDGMLLKPQVDDQALQRLTRLTGGGDTQ
ncbi:MAG: HlyD family efflux transporter periplasmic adaptor subunit [Candidatus Sedimenticola sp. (ex Thyasira tokunagai)]